MRGFLGTKAALIVASLLLFVMLWGLIAQVGWSGASSDDVAVVQETVGVEETGPAAEPAPEVIIRKVYVIRRIHQVAEEPAQAAVPAAPPALGGGGGGGAVARSGGS